MAKAHATWTVLDHGPIEKLSDNLWRVEGGLPGAPLKRVMSVAKRADGKLVVHNGICLGEKEMKELDAWGEVGFIVVPNGFHRLDAKVFADRYPNAKVLCPAGTRKKVEQVVGVHGGYEDFPEDERVALETIEGTGAGEGALIVKEGGASSLVLNDLVFNSPHFPGFVGFVLRRLTNSTGGPRISRISRWFLVKEKKAVAAHMERLAELPGLARVVVSHHETITNEPAKTLRDVAATL